MAAGITNLLDVWGRVARLHQQQAPHRWPLVQHHPLIGPPCAMTFKACKAHTDVFVVAGNAHSCWVPPDSFHTWRIQMHPTSQSRLHTPPLQPSKKNVIRYATRRFTTRIVDLIWLQVTGCAWYQTCKAQRSICGVVLRAVQCFVPRVPWCIHHAAARTAHECKVLLQMHARTHVQLHHGTLRDMVAW